MINHMKADISGLLRWSDKKLSDLFDRSGKKVRIQLKGLQAKGDIYIPCGECDNFDPKEGCLGHPDKEATI